MSEKKSGFKTFLTKIRHNKMVSLGLVLAICGGGLTATSVGAGVIAAGKNKIDLTQVAKYSTEFEFSKTGIKGKVVDVATDSIHKQAFILLGFEDLGTLSLDANNYTVYVTAVNDRIDTYPTGSFYIFGSTGYAGVYLSNVDGFDQQILDITIRNNAEMAVQQTSVFAETDMTEVTQESTESTESADPFVQYDQASVYANLGAELTTKLDSLSSDTIMKPSAVYEELVLREQETALKTSLGDMIKEFSVLETQEEEYAKRLRSAEITVPDRPTYIQNTKIKDGRLEDDIWFDMVPHFDWTNVTVAESDLLKNMIDEYNNQDGVETKMSSENVYLAAIKEHLQSKTIKGEPYTFELPSSWYYTNGALFDTTLDINGETQAISSDMNAFTNVWNQMYELKNSYSETLYELLKLDFAKETRDKDFTVNNSDSAIVVWQSQ